MRGHEDRSEHQPSYARVARTSSTSFPEQRANARRWTTAETRSRIGAAARFRFGPPTAAQLEHLVERYQVITGDLIRTRQKRNLFAACYRVHGADLIPIVADEYTLQGTA